MHDHLRHQLRRSRHLSPLNAALWIGVGAVAGIVVGVALADRFAGGRVIGRRLARAAVAFEALFDRARGSIGRRRSTHRTREAAGSEFGAEGDHGPAPASFFAADDQAHESTDRDTEDDDAETGDDDAEETSVGELDARVLAAFLQDPILSERAVEIDAPETGTIVLRGRVPSERDAAHAVIIARGTPGVERVENRLRVRRAQQSPPPRSTSRR
jgi:hypothetical protein